MPLPYGDTYRLTDSEHKAVSNAVGFAIPKSKPPAKSLSQSAIILGLEALVGTALAAINPAVLPYLIELVATQGFAAAASAIKSYKSSKQTPVNNPLTNQSSNPSVAAPTIGPVQKFVPRAPVGNFVSNIPIHVSQMATRKLSKPIRTLAKKEQVVHAPVAKGLRSHVSNKPRMRSKGRNLVVTHSELIGSLYSSATTLSYRSQAFILNPGKYSTFPWLANMASNYDKYKFNFVNIKLVSNQPTSTGGRIGVGIDYDSTDPQPADRNEFFSLTHHGECAPWDSILFPVPLQGGVRFVNSHTTTDSKLIDCGQLLFFSDQIVATNAALADIIIEYEVELIDAQQAVFSTMSSYGLNPAAGVMNAVGPVIGQIQSTSPAGRYYYTVPQGCYLITWCFNESGGAQSDAVVYTTTGGTGYYCESKTANTCTGFGLVKVVSNDATLGVGTTTTNTAEERSHIMITRVSAALYYNFTVYTSPTALGFVEVTYV